MKQGSQLRADKTPEPATSIGIRQDLEPGGNQHLEMKRSSERQGNGGAALRGYPGLLLWVKTGAP